MAIAAIAVTVGCNGDDARSGAEDSRASTPALRASGTLSTSDDSFDWAPNESSFAYTPLFVRTTDDGIRLQAYSWSRPDEPKPDCYPDGWCTPPECIATKQLRVGITYGSSFFAGSGSAFEKVTLPAHVAGVAELGHQGGDAAVIVMVQVHDPEVEFVRLRLRGAQDTMAPSGGVAVVAVPFAPSQDRSASFRAAAVVDVLDANGHLLTQLRPGDGYGDLSLEQCRQPSPRPPTLPPAGVAPSNASAAAEAVKKAFRDWVRDGDPPALMDFTDQLRALDAKIRAIIAKSGLPATVKFGDLVFESPTVAWFQFEWYYGDDENAGLGWELGSMVLLDGKWRLPRTTACAFYHLPAASC